MPSKAGITPAQIASRRRHLADRPNARVTACGRLVTSPIRVPTTMDPDEVTCVLCQRSVRLTSEPFFARQQEHHQAQRA